MLTYYGGLCSIFQYLFQLQSSSLHVIIALSGAPGTIATFITGQVLYIFEAVVRLTTVII